MKVVASARKSCGEYKPIIIFPNGRTQVVEQNTERCDVYTKHGRIKGDKFARGKTYKSREEAVTAAENEIIHRLEIVLHQYKNMRMNDYIKAQIEMWGGEVNK